MIFGNFASLHAVSLWNVLGSKFAAGKITLTLTPIDFQALTTKCDTVHGVFNLGCRTLVATG